MLSSKPWSILALTTADSGDQSRGDGALRAKSPCALGPLRQTGTASRLYPDRRRGNRLHRCRAAHGAPGRRAQGAAGGQGYDGDRFRESLLIRGILPIIPPRSNRKVPEHPDYRRYRDRNRAERMFGKLKQERRIAIRYDKTVLFFESFLNLAAARLSLKSLVNTA